MNRSDPNLAKVELIAAALGALCDELVIGVALVFGSMARNAATPAGDVDLVVIGTEDCRDE